MAAFLLPELRPQTGRTIQAKAPNDNDLITRRKFYSYSRPSVVWCGAGQEVKTVREMLKELYFGNIRPAERQTTPSSNLQRELERCQRQ